MGNKPPKNKAIEIVGTDDEGRAIRLYEDGSVRNWHGQLVTEPPYAVRITKETSPIMQKKRKDKIIAAIESRLMDITHTNLPADAIAAIVAKRATIAMSDETRVGNEAAKIVLQAVNAYQDKAEQTTVTRNEYVIDTDTITMLEQMFDRRTVIDADTEDVE